MKLVFYLVTKLHTYVSKYSKSYSAHLNSHDGKLGWINQRKIKERGWWVRSEIPDCNILATLHNLWTKTKNIIYVLGETYFYYKFSLTVLSLNILFQKQMLSICFFENIWIYFFVAFQFYIQICEYLLPNIWCL